MKIMELSKKTLVVFSGILMLTAGITGCTGYQGGSDRNSSRQGGSQQGPPPSKAQLFSQYDKDHDGKLSKEEFPGPDKDFTQFDVNQDGFLDKDEVPDSPPSGPKKG
ncbi:putative calcium-binding EF hand domain protein [Desulforapulum autotrophicum HRM2]|uniref:Calcium-binding EF hand domain protein n=1 Tax=Desulforapulum autotrophicum (strain ATCC 43914 / DSM 3382 / VKM B-1955 / HRM2) TaxID=177437 RepID=C0QEC0_DESAH|nr:EF-hand domain-containing protein [Desulforapulum autotrophicum]ACN13237.1 putative calcium-binding EF hand domain protein [Desulforapulum autotrophicum HRM2]